VSRIEHPDNVASHYDGGYAYAGYGGCTSQQQMMEAEEGNRESRSTRDVSSGATLLLMTEIQCFTKRASAAEEGGFRRGALARIAWKWIGKIVGALAGRVSANFVRFANSFAFSNDASGIALSGIKFHQV